MSDVSYEIPALLKEIMQWEKEMADQVPYLETPSGLFLGIQGDGNGGYSCSPIDSITFAGTGMDGIHYALLTDFGTVTKLEEAPVICISPMDFGNCVRLVARNLHDFFSIQLFDTGALLNDFDSEERYLDYRRRAEEEDNTSEYFDHRLWKEQRELVAKTAREKFGLPFIPNSFQYMKELRAERQQQIAIKTRDGLGVAAWPNGVGTNDKPHPWSHDDIPYDDLELLQAFFDTSETETKLALIRDYQSEGIADLSSLELICKELKKMGLFCEAKKLYECMGR
ncbi:hypothetical protein ACI7RC_22915 [Brevibacillus sp. B_LB10_24]|uniref:hypothetical protein n=1 Tax=Brevibacillus sp. B_LB10_24 TaxID=3380645 RepID=UPI0038BD2B9D